MPYNGSGTFSLTYDWTTEQASSPIEISKLDEQEADIAAGLSNCILRDGTGQPTSATPWNSQNLTGVGTFTAVTGTFSGSVTATALIPSSSTVPANGLYLPSANTVGIASNTTLRASVNSTGNWTFSAPSSGTALTVNGSIDTVADQSSLLTLGRFSAGYPWALIRPTASAGIEFRNNAGTAIMQLANAGNVTINAPSSGTALALTAVSGGVAATATDGTVTHTLASFSSGKVSTGTTSAHSYNIWTNNTERVSVASAGNVAIDAPSSGTALTVSGVAGALNTSNTAAGLTYTNWVNSANSITSEYGVSAVGGFLGTATAHPVKINTSNTSRIEVSSSGNVTINAASSGDELTVTGSVVATSFAGDGSGLTSMSATQLTSGTVPDARFPATLPAASGVNLTALNASNLASGTVPAARIGSSTGYAIGDGSTVNSIQIGFRGIPQNAQTGNYTCVLADAGKHIYHASGAGAGDTYTIPANGSVAYAIGTAITFINRAVDAISIAITTDTLTHAGTGSTGTRTLAAYGVATAIKITSTEWIISGTGLS